MRILFVLPFIPCPPADGGRMKVFSLLKCLSAKHQCDLLCIADETPETRPTLAADLPHVGKVMIIPPRSGWSKWLHIVWQLFRGRPPSFARYPSRDVRALLAATELNAYDAIHYDIINMAQYQPLARFVASVHSPNDATSNVYWRRARASETVIGWVRLFSAALLLRRYEQRHYRDFSWIHVVSEADRDYLLTLDPQINITVIPISSGYSAQTTTTAARLRVQGPDPEGQRPTIAICGNLADAGIAGGLADFLDEVLPNLYLDIPGLRVCILGRGISERMLRKIQSCSAVEYAAYVEDFEAFLGAADVLLALDRVGAPGAKTRVVQAMALGLPVVGSPTAFEGIPMMNSGIHGIVYESSRECASALTQLLGDKALRVRLGESASALAAREYSLEAVAARYEALYVSAMNSHAQLVRDACRSKPEVS